MECSNAIFDTLRFVAWAKIVNPDAEQIFSYWLAHHNELGISAVEFARRVERGEMVMGQFE